MLKFVKKHMETIDGVEIYPILSLLIFFIFFSFMLWHVIKAKKEYIDSVSNLPLDNENNEEL